MASIHNFGFAVNSFSSIRHYDQNSKSKSCARNNAFGKFPNGRKTHFKHLAKRKTTRKKTCSNAPKDACRNFWGSKPAWCVWVPYFSPKRSNFSPKFRSRIVYPPVWFVVPKRDLAGAYGPANICRVVKKKPFRQREVWRQALTLNKKNKRVKFRSPGGFM